jgi:predicted alpha/beta hydrolase
VGDLPAGVIWQWRRWCLNPLYAMGVEGRWAAEAYAAAHYPLHALYFEDDEMMSLASVQALVDWYKSAPSTLERVDPGWLRRTHRPSGVFQGRDARATVAAPAAFAAELARR